MTSDVLTIQRRSDATPALLEQLKDEGGCAGKWHKLRVKRHDEYIDIEAPCLGNKTCLTGFTQTEVSVDPNSDAANLVREIIHASQTRKAAEKAGIPYDEIQRQEILFNETQSVFCTPKAVTMCPCAREEKRTDFVKQMRDHLGVEGEHKLYASQRVAKELFADGKNLYVYGLPDCGKTHIAAVIAENFHRRVHHFVGEEISTYFQRLALSNSDVDFEGLLLLDDCDKNTPTANFCRKLWMCLNLAKSRKLRMIITGNMNMVAFVKKYADGLDEKESTENRLSRFEEIEIK